MFVQILSSTVHLRQEFVVPEILLRRLLSSYSQKQDFELQSLLRENQELKATIARNNSHGNTTSSSASDKIHFSPPSSSQRQDIIDSMHWRGHDSHVSPISRQQQYIQQATSQTDTNNNAKRVIYSVKKFTGRLAELSSTKTSSHDIAGSPPASSSSIDGQETNQSQSFNSFHENYRRSVHISNDNKISHGDARTGIGTSLFPDNRRLSSLQTIDAKKAALSESKSLPSDVNRSGDAAVAYRLRGVKDSFPAKNQGEQGLYHMMDDDEAKIQREMRKAEVRETICDLS